MDWERKRTLTFVVFSFYFFLRGFHFAIIYSSLWFYLEDVIQVSNPRIFYGFAIPAYHIGSVIISFSFGKYVDNHRHTKKHMLILVSMQVLGNIIYSLYYSGYFVVVGRLIFGFGDLCNGIIVGEISRSYPKKQVTEQVAILSACLSIGMVFSSVILIIIQDVKFSICNFQINYGNSPGLLLALLHALLLVFTIFMVSDLSKEFDLKSYLREKEKSKRCVIDTKSDDCTSLLKSDIDKADILSDDHNHKKLACQETDNKSTENSRKNDDDGTISLVLKLLSHHDIVVTILIGTFVSYVLYAFDSLLSPITSSYFGFRSRETSLLFLIQAINLSLFSVALRYLTKIASDYKMTFIVMVILNIGLLFTILLNILQTYHVVALVLLVLYLLALSIAWTIEEVLTRTMLAKLVPSHCQSFAEGLRRSCSCFAAIIGGLMAPLFLDHIIYFGVILMVLAILLSILLFRRREQLKSCRQLFD